MIARMKKLTVLCMAAHAEDSLEALRDLGVLHLSHIQPPRGESVEEARTHLAHVHRALDSLPKHHEKTPSGRSGEEVVKDIWDFIREKKRLAEERDYLVQERARIEPFGSFAPSAITGLEEKGLFVALYRAPARDVISFPDNVVVQEFKRDKNNVWFAAISKGPVGIDAERVRLPEFSLQQVDEKLAAIGTALEENEVRLTQHAHDYDVVAQLHAEAEDRVRYVEAREGMGASKAVAYLRGYCPEEAVGVVRKAAAANGWGLVVTEPAAEDAVPTLITNPRWVAIIKPVFDFMGIAPGYDEVDISACFLLFFSLFFGMIVGDAGYGLLFLVFTLAGRKVLKKTSPLIVPLLLVMSICTLVWGLLTGTFFGIGRIPTILQHAQVEWLRDNDNIMLLCFIIGAVHLTIAHGWGAIRIINAPQALAQLGWILSTWGMFFVACNMVLRYPLPSFLGPLFLVAVVLIAAFMTPLKKLKTEFFNHVLLPLNLISNFVDVVSYIRLFAVGLATFAVGNAFNGLAVGGGVHSILAGLGAALILFGGHALNIIMALMGVMVHGIRLNTLEFSGHLGMQWTGVKYHPFARKRSAAITQPEGGV